jgi:hypothetical protein
LLDACPEFLYLFEFAIFDKVHEFEALQDTCDSGFQFVSGSEHAKEM